MQRSAMRELAFKLVYEIEVQKESEEEQFEIFIENNEITKDAVIEYLKDIKEGIKTNCDEINTLISNNLKDNWSLNRISKINLSLIKLAIYEMVYKGLPSPTEDETSEKEVEPENTNSEENNGEE